ncbi:MAG: universal stress protein [Acidobacteriota bacterium]|jgi:nucleotide-binding universal stress UspA family protein
MPEPIRHVVAATDFSEPADLGLAWAARIARTHRAKLTLVHALAPPMPVADFAAPPLHVDQELRASAEKRLEEALQRAPLDGIEADTALRDGTPSQAVLDLVQEVEADLLVVGTRGLTGFQHLLLGSTAERIVQRSPVPVLSVHPGDGLPEREPRTIMVPTDFSLDAEAALDTTERALSLVEAETRVLLLHVFHVPAEYRSYGPAGSFFEFTEELSQTLEERMGELARPFRDRGLTVETLVAEGIPAEVVVRTAEEHGVDLIAMGTHGRSGLAHLLLGSTAERVVQHAGCPVLTVRQGEG